MKKKSIAGTIVIFFGLLFFMGGLYLLPVGTDIYLYFWVEIVAHGDWLIGDVLANAFAVGMIVLGLFMLREEGVKPGVKKTKKRR